MDSERDVDFRLRLAQGFLDEARDDVERSRWRSGVDNSQLSVENAIKAVIARHAPVPRTHNLAPLLDELLATASLSTAQREAVVALCACADELGPEQHVRSDYGEEASFQTPWDLFGEDDARRSLTVAEQALALARSILDR